MTEATQHKTSLGVFAGFVGVILAALVALAFAPASAQAAPQNFGGLVFELTDTPGATVQNVGYDNGVVTINNGDSNYTVTQANIQQEGKATQLKITGTYTGTITLQGVTQLVAGDSASAITFNGSGATVVLANGTKISGGPAVSMPGQVDGGPTVNADSLPDTLIVQSGSSITGAGTTGTAISAGVNTTNAYNVIQLDGGTIAAGSGNGAAIVANGGSVVDGNLTLSTLTIEANEDTVVSGFSGTGNNPALTVQNGLVTLTGDAGLALQGGNGNSLTGDTPGTTGANAVTVTGGTLELGNAKVSGCSLQVVGGNGANAQEDEEVTNNHGGNGVFLNAAGNGATANFNVNSGSLIARGGVGGSALSGATKNPSGAAGFEGIEISDSKGGKAAVTINGGTVLVQGGNGGNAGSEEGDQGAGAPAIASSEGSDTGSTLTVQYNPEAGATIEPTVILVGGKGYDEEADVLSPVITNVNGGETGGENDGVFINTTAQGNGGAIADAPNYLWVAYTTTSGEAPTAEAQGTLQGFAGMNNDKEIPQGEANIKVLAAMQQSFAAAGNCWACITSAPLESINSAVKEAMSGANTNPTVNYVVAQTQQTMSGSLPPSMPSTQGDYQHIYVPSFQATFEGLENVNTTVFGDYSGITAGGATETPEDMVSSYGLPTTVTNSFYVLKTAQGNQLTVTPGENNTIPANITDLYGEDIDITPATLSVVYTINITKGPGTTGGLNPNTTPLNVYTSANGSGALVDTLGGVAPEDAIKQITTGTNTASTTFLGLFDEATDPYTQVDINQVTGWDHNANLTAEWGALTLKGIAPSPTTLGQGNSTELTATYELTPNNKNLTSYSMHASGVDVVAWDAVYVAQNIGGAAANGVTVEATGSNLATGEAPLTVTSVATVTANGTATLGHYRVWPVLGQTSAVLDSIPSAKPDSNAIYAAVEVVAGVAVPEGQIAVWRVYNPYTLEHLYTTSEHEATTLDNAGWDPEGVAWVAPTKSDLPIYRLYNPFNGDHMYTISVAEYNALDAAGWDGEGEQMYSASNSDGVDIYRLYNPWMNADDGAFSHLWTADFNEYQTLGRQGWNQESVAFWAIAADLPAE